MNLECVSTLYCDLLYMYCRVVTSRQSSRIRINNDLNVHITNTTTTTTSTTTTTTTTTNTTTTTSTNSNEGRQWKIYPWLSQKSHLMCQSNRFKPVTFPDLTRENDGTRVPGGSVSISAGDFLDIYKIPGRWV